MTTALVASVAIPTREFVMSLIPTIAEQTVAAGKFVSLITVLMRAGTRESALTAIVEFIRTLMRIWVVAQPMKTV
jgi:hypothetical protein